MKIAMPVEGETVNQHFGRSQKFLIATIENDKVISTREIGAEALAHNHAGLSGLLIEQGVSLVILGGIGQPALDALKNAGLDVIRGVSGRCDEALQRYIRGELKDQNVSCNHDGGHHHHQ